MNHLIKARTKTQLENLLQKEYCDFVVDVFTDSTYWYAITSKKPLHTHKNHCIVFFENGELNSIIIEKFANIKVDLQVKDRQLKIIIKFEGVDISNYRFIILTTTLNYDLLDEFVNLKNVLLIFVFQNLTKITINKLLKIISNILENVKLAQEEK